ncbi:uncharacterized protein BXZ73DRAFT_91541 [Epithele typhae]|uniref:uncharacterized protein n=1 Tax=Epithele typhae TaxID=378194 RepID=UPI00200897E4|nr:uncharacterized protein BXZ73DRAFT_91541 [Epithele typhae]KAH9922823.1 hypothetical protein BXZ73DRAFT_91541 [Epithele typhae]
MANLPAELVAAILEHVYYTATGAVDSQTLASAALVCRHWQESAQRLLFKRVSLKGHRHEPAYLSFVQATDLATSRGRSLAQNIRVLEVSIGDSPEGLDESDLVNLIVGIRAIAILSCGIQSPILYQLLSIWPCVNFLHLGVEIAAPPPKAWQPSFQLYELALMRTPRLWVFSWLLSSSTDSLRILTFRDLPWREFDPLLDKLGPRLRSLRLQNYSLRAVPTIRRCPNLEEFIVLRVPELIKLTPLPQTVEHLSCRFMLSENGSLAQAVDLVGSLPRLRVFTCDSAVRKDEHIRDLETLCAAKGVELCFDETPFWLREDPVPVQRFPRWRSVTNYALMN